VVFVALPIAIIFNLFLGRFISGFTMGAVKGWRLASAGQPVSRVSSSV
jgi:hypothetical protein